MTLTSRATPGVPAPTSLGSSTGSVASLSRDSRRRASIPTGEAALA
jgi:hypothetical protein